MNPRSSKTNPQAQTLASLGEPTYTENLANPVIIPLETAALSNPFPLPLDGDVALHDHFLQPTNVDHAWPGQTFTPHTVSSELPLLPI